MADSHELGDALAPIGEVPRHFAAVAKARGLLGQVPVKEADYSGTDAARFFGVSVPAVNRLPVRAELSGLKKYLNAL